MEKGGGVGQGLGCGHQQGRPRGPAKLSRALHHPAPPYKGGERRWGEGPGSRGSRDARGGGRGARGSRPSATLGPTGGARTRGRALLAPPRRAPGQSRCPGLPTPPGLGCSPRRPPAGLTRRGGARPAAPRGSRTAAEGCPRPRRPRRPHARRPPPAAPDRRASPAESAALTSPARGAPSAAAAAAAAAAGARPVPAAPAAAPARAPRPRKRRGQGRWRCGTGLSRTSGPRVPPRPRLGASPRTRGRAAASVRTPGGSGGGPAPQGLQPAFSSAPPAGGRRAPQRGAPRVSPRGEESGAQDPRPATARVGCACDHPGLALPFRDPRSLSASGAYPSPEPRPAGQLKAVRCSGEKHLPHRVT
ncbi:unnamed protein product [Nyctereutes procyonoides]|uniref:(raccoon dog) hypothetical protein n=1 Tax=Nyctereutes procyonoides TaxID=34880 RepID=A0A811XYN0_NYCPR|nr:unnamed protein product [Nyctereutes procyonoides]